MNEEKKEETKEEKKETPKEETKEAPKEEVKEAPKTVKETEPEEEVEVPKKFKKIVEEIETMTVLDLAELVKLLEKKLGVTAAVAAAPIAAAQNGAETASAGEEKSVFTIELKDAGSKKIEVIKVVRDITGQGLKEAKDIVDSVPKTLRENVQKEEAEEIKKKLEEAGATVELK